MRVTTNLMVTNTLRRLSDRLESYESKQEQLATGRRVVRPSDDPSAAAKALGLRSSIRAREQEVRNADDALTLLDTADGELQSAMTTMQRVRDLAVRAGNDLGPTEREAIARELTALRDQLVSLANAQSGERSLFSGTVDGPAVQQVGGVWTYTGDDGAVQRRVSPQDRVQVNVTAEDAFGFAAGADIFTTIDQLVTDLGADDRAGIQASLGRIDTAFSATTEQLARIGAVTNRVEGARNRVEGTVLTLRGELAEVQDVDLEEAIMDLRVEEVAYEATLSALGRSLPQSLVSFLR